MKPIKVVGDPNNTPFCSSETIISSLNKALDKIGYYDDNGEIVIYDCLGKNHGFESNNIICPYETAIPNLVIDNADGRRLIGVSNQNQLFFTMAGYPQDKTDFFLLGVDSELWKPYERPENEVFRFGMMCDSNTRACYDTLLPAFGETFTDRVDVCLFIKDRWATNQFKSYVSQISEAYKVQIILNDEHITNKQHEKDMYNMLDCHIFLNHSSTFALTATQGMAMAKPTITMEYSGPKDYCNILNSYPVEFVISDIDEFYLNYLVNIGLRNYLLPPNPKLFSVHPQWANPVLNSLKKQMMDVFNNKKQRNQIGQNARITAQSLSWEKAAVNLLYIVSK